MESPAQSSAPVRLRASVACAATWQSRPGTSDSSAPDRAARRPARYGYSQCKRHRLGAPLFLELVRAAARCRAAEVERVAAVGDGGLDRVPVQKMVRAQGVELAQRRRPWHLDRASGPVRDAGSDRAAAASRTTMTRVRSGNARHDLVEEAARVDRRAEVAHVAREDPVEVGQQLRAAALGRRGLTSRPFGPGCGPCGRTDPTDPAASGRRIVTLCWRAGTSAKRRPTWRSSTCRQPRDRAMIARRVDERARPCRRAPASTPP